MFLYLVSNVVVVNENAVAAREGGDQVGVPFYFNLRFVFHRSFVVEFHLPTNCTRRRRYCNQHDPISAASVTVPIFD